MSLPLKGIIVLDLTMFVAGPFGSMILSDLGAEVIKIEPLNGDPLRSNHSGGQINQENAQFHSYNRNKQSLCLDLKSEIGKKLFYDLVLKSDIVFNNFRPGVTDRLGISHRNLSKINKKIISCSLSAFGQNGPWKEKPGYDLIVQALGGGMSLTGHNETGPAHIPFHLGDTAGGLYATIGILAALADRQRTGLGRNVDISMLDAQISLLGDVITNYSVSKETPEMHGSGHPDFFPYQAFSTADEPLVIAAVGVEKFWINFCKVMGREDLVEDKEYKNNILRVKNRKKLECIFSKIFLKDKRDNWLDKLTNNDIPCAPILSATEAIKTPQVLSRGMVQNYNINSNRYLIAGNPVKFEEAIEEFNLAPKLGQDSQYILKKYLSYPEEKINDLIFEGIIK